VNVNFDLFKNLNYIIELVIIYIVILLLWNWTI